MKEKISITVDAELIKRADSLVDGVTIRNRSQALEHLLRKGLSEQDVNCAVILAGGNPKKLEFEGTCKPLVKIDGTPIIINTIQQLKRAGVSKIIIAAGSIADRLLNVVGDGSEYGVSITYVKDSGLGTAGAIWSAKKHLSGPFFVVFGDVYFDFGLEKMVGFHKANSSEATMAVSVTELGESYDSIKIVGNRITEFQYGVGKVRTHHVNAGVYLLNHSILRMVPKTGSLEMETLPKLAKEGRLTAFVFSGKWKHLK